MIIEHAGVKGMRWGFRKPEETTAGRSNKSSVSDISKAEKKAATRKKVALVGIGATALVGAAVVGVALKKSGASPISSIKKTKAETLDRGRQFINQTNKKRKDLPSKALYKGIDYVAGRGEDGARRSLPSPQQLRILQAVANKYYGKEARSSARIAENARMYDLITQEQSRR